jgi:hypothetical protein
MLPRTSRLFAALTLLAVAGIAWGATELPNLALKKTATASSSEDANPPQNAVDGDIDTRWCNADASPDCWWKIDLGKPQPLAGCEIHWEHDGAVYKYVIEGSTDDKTWKVLNDQRASKQSSQLQKLTLTGDPVRYVRITVTELEEGSWASFFEFKLFDADSMKKLTPAEARAFLAPAPVKPPATAPAR